MANTSNHPPALTPGQEVPTLDDVQKTITVLLFALLANFQRSGLNGLTINSVGTILSKLTFDGKQSKDDIKKMIEEAATKELELVKVEMLRESLISGTRIH